MKDFFRKTFLFSVGAATVTKEKIEEFVEELIQRGQASEKDRSKLVEEYLQKLKEQEKEFAARVKTLVTKTLTDMGIPTREEIAALEKRIAELEARLGETGTGESKPKRRRGRPPKKSSEKKTGGES